MKVKVTFTVMKVLTMIKIVVMKGMLKEKGETEDEMDNESDDDTNTKSDDKNDNESDTELDKESDIELDNESGDETDNASEGKSGASGSCPAPLSHHSSPFPWPHNAGWLDGLGQQYSVNPVANSYVDFMVELV